jgi:hypothetical protein
VHKVSAQVWAIRICWIWKLIWDPEPFRSYNIRLTNSITFPRNASSAYTRVRLSMLRLSCTASSQLVRRSLQGAMLPPTASSCPPLVLVVCVALIDVPLLPGQPVRVLVAQRPPGKANAGLWEFPGGKVRFVLVSCPAICLLFAFAF